MVIVKMKNGKIKLYVCFILKFFDKVIVRNYYFLLVIDNLLLLFVNVLGIFGEDFNGFVCYLVFYLF